MPSKAFEIFLETGKRPFIEVANSIYLRIKMIFPNLSWEPCKTGRGLQYNLISNEQADNLMIVRPSDNLIAIYHRKNYSKDLTGIVKRELDRFKENGKIMYEISKLDRTSGKPFYTTYKISE